MTQAEAIRQHLQRRYIEPARKRGETLVTINAGDIHKELGLRNRVPNVCQAMESRILERQAGIKVSSKQGPPKGRGTSLTITYRVEKSEQSASVPKPGSISRDESLRLFYELEGSAKEAFAAVGGGEAWLKKERANFYGPFKRKKML